MSTSTYRLSNPVYTYRTVAPSRQCGLSLVLFEFLHVVRLSVLRGSLHLCSINNRFAANLLLFSCLFLSYACKNPSLYIHRVTSSTLNYPLFYLLTSLFHLLLPPTFHTPFSRFSNTFTGRRKRTGGFVKSIKGI